MRNSILIVTILVLSGCKSVHPVIDNYQSESLIIEKVNDNIYKHISYLDTESYGRVPCNGMIYFNEDDVIIFDTPTNNKASTELIAWIGKKEVKAVIVTHFHVDCLGGLEQFHSNDIESYASNLTIELAGKDNRIVPKNGFDKRIEFKIGNKVAYAEFFGEGHTRDNVICYVPSENAMFGGCLIKEINAGKGYLADANTADWPETVEKIKREINGMEIVIPGHGKSGGIELLDYTIELFSEK